MNIIHGLRDARFFFVNHMCYSKTQAIRPSVENHFSTVWLLQNLAPVAPAQPIRRKTKISRDLVTRSFSRLAPV